MIVGEQYLCISDDRTYKIVKIEKANVILSCLDCVSIKEPFPMTKEDFGKLTNGGSWKLSKGGVVVPVVEKPKEEVKQEVKEKEELKPLPTYKPKPKDIDLFS